MRLGLSSVPDWGVAAGAAGDTGAEGCWFCGGVVAAAGAVADGCRSCADGGAGAAAGVTEPESSGGFCGAVGLVEEPEADAPPVWTEFWGSLCDVAEAAKTNSAATAIAGAIRFENLTIPPPWVRPGTGFRSAANHLFYPIRRPFRDWHSPSTRTRYVGDEGEMGTGTVTQSFAVNPTESAIGTPRPGSIRPTTLQTVRFDDGRDGFRCQRFSANGRETSKAAWFGGCRWLNSELRSGAIRRGSRS